MCGVRRHQQSVQDHRYSKIIICALTTLFVPKQWIWLEYIVYKSGNLSISPFRQMKRHHGLMVRRCFPVFTSGT